MVSSASAIAVTEAAEATINREEPSVRQALMARHGHPRAPLMTCGDIFRIIIALFIPPLGVFTQVGLTQPFWINLVSISLPLVALASQCCLACGQPL